MWLFITVVSSLFAETKTIFRDRNLCLKDFYCDPLKYTSHQLNPIALN